MNKVAEDLTIQIPPDLAKACEIQPGDEMEWSRTGKRLHLSPATGEELLPVEERLKRFKQLTEWAKEISSPAKGPQGPGRGWTREDLYDPRSH